MNIKKLKTTHLGEVISKSEIRDMTNEAEKRGALNLSQGVCNLPLPNGLIDAAYQAMWEENNSYTYHGGIKELREAIAEKSRDFNKIECGPDHITVSSGATGALYCTCMALLERGDQVIVFEPYYGYHVNTLLSLGVDPVFFPFAMPEMEIDLELLKDRITEKTRAIIINTPANPSGKVFSMDELLGIGKICREKGCFIITDEIYEYFVYDGKQHISPGALSELADITITISGYSKTFSITGWRIGYSIAPENITKIIGYMSDLVYVCAPAPLQHGLLFGLKNIDKNYYIQLREQFQGIRNQLVTALNQAGLPAVSPQGAYYIMADASCIPGENSKSKAMWLLEKVGIATVPGEAFCNSGKSDYLRFCFAKKTSEIDEACQRLQSLKNKI